MNRTIFWLRTALVLAASVLSGCRGEVELGVVAGLDACHRCNMVIDQVNQACGYIEDDRLVVFDSPVCLLGRYEEFRNSRASIPVQIFFADYNDGLWHPAKSTAFLHTDHIPTIMNAGVVAFGSSEAAEEMRRHPDEKVTDWIGFQTVRGTPNRVVAVLFSDNAMVPDTVELEKGDLGELRMKGDALAEDLTIAVTGYPETGEVTVPASGEEVGLRILALRPGSGFPVIDVSGGRALGRVKVSGAHTLDEEEM